ncbi:hypothetical protein CRG98_011984 [Punica granatum]|uniref:Integrase catalytic domain-containing protein n=1 Tax=Punica granatum TaxID=22663 RepID=A0A2I0KGL1_PUNGR|nr:hypothetical protein CRG98_011984 [Punica granatum]
METDCVKHVRHCHRCHVYADQMKALPNELCSMTALCLSQSIDYFTKWIEAITLASVTAKAVAHFLKRDVIARYGVLATIITDNAKNLNNKVIDELCAQFKIRHRNSTPYRPQMNCAVEAANKNIKKIIEKMMVNYKDWHKMLPYALLAYRTSIRTSTGATPYSLVYGMEACYQQRMARAFNAKVRHREFSPGDLVLRKVLHVAPDSRGKFLYKYDGPFIVKETFSGGAVILSDMDGTENVLPVNADAIKKSETSSRRPRQKLGNEWHDLKSRKGESQQKESINHFLARSKTLKGRPRQKLGNEWHDLKSRKGESQQKESINHFLARSKTLKGRPRQKRDREPQRMLPADGFMSASRGRSWSRGAGNRRGMRHTAKTDDVQRRTNDRRSSSAATHEAVQTRAPIEPYHTALHANSKFHPGLFRSIPVCFGSIPVVCFGSIPVYSGPSRSVRVHLDLFGFIPIYFGSIPVCSSPSRSVLGPSRSISGPSRLKVPIRVHPGLFRVYPGLFRSIPVKSSYSGPSRSASGRSWSIRVHPSLKFLFESIPTYSGPSRSVRVHPGLNSCSGPSWFKFLFGSIPVCSGPSRFKFLFGSIPVYSGPSRFVSGPSRFKFLFGSVPI